MKPFLVALLIIAAQPAFADNDGYYCKGKGYIAFERWMTDDDHIFIVPFGRDGKIGDLISFKLPKKINMNVQALDCGPEVLNLRLRSVTYDRSSRPPKIASDRIQQISISVKRVEKLWVRNSSEESPKNKADFFASTLPNLGNWSRPQTVPLESSDGGHTYELSMTDKQDSQVVSGVGGNVYHHHKTSLIQRDPTGLITAEKIIFEGVFDETID